MFNRAVVVLALVLTLFTGLYADNEMLTANLFAREGAFMSSAFAMDSSALFINPAALYRIDRLTLQLSARSLTDIHYFGMGMIMPVVGGSLAGGVYQYPIEGRNNKSGFTLGYGNVFFGWTSAGISLRTCANDVLNVTDGILADAAVMIFPNTSLRGDLWKSPWINNRIFLSLAVQNIGISPSSVAGETIQGRIGLGYSIYPIWTKIFVDKVFSATRSPWIVGLEINPEADFWDVFSARFSTDFEDYRFGLSLQGNDIRADAAYYLRGNQYQVGFTGYFERDRTEQSQEAYDQGMNLLNEAQELEKAGKSEDAFDLYHQAYHQFEKAVTLDGENRKAAYQKAQIGDKMTDYQNTYVDKAEKAYSEKKMIAALYYYNLAYGIFEDNSALSAKVKETRQSAAVQKYVKSRKVVIRKAMADKNYLLSAKESERLLTLFPDDGELKGTRDQSRSQLKSIARERYADAQESYREGNYEDAVKLAQVALANDPELTKARDLIRLSQANLSTRKGLDRAQQLFKQKNYVGAYRMAEFVLSKNPDNKDAQDLKTRVVSIFKANEARFLENGQNFYNNGDYENAIAELDKVLLANPGNSTAQDYRTRAQTKQKALEKLGNLEEEE